MGHRRRVGLHRDIITRTHHDVPMRTTLTLDEDVADFLKEQSRLQDKPFKQVVHEVFAAGHGVRSTRA